ncbi:7885_t:CDS:2 [Dentiscutata heterogama]|uniref:7885_t:CDS:1 n=1 Tax=Dentiscutata heterogama TaxID=1316150 RepID=A0ACA9MSQ6_9GLOM|nr:7885_t:CDS:2 [Dentiscutata heterogama]
MDCKRTHIPQDTVVVSRKSIFGQFDYVEPDEINIKENIEKRLFEKLQEVNLDVNRRNDDDNQYMQENQQDVLFRLFARDPPTKISLESNEIKDYNKQVGIVKAKVDELKTQKSEAKRFEQIIDTVITSSEVIMQSKIPWERTTKNKTHGGISPSWPRGGKDAYGWKLNCKIKINCESKVYKREIHTKKGIVRRFERVA